MIFKEQSKGEHGFVYTVEDIFGTIDIISDKRLTKDQLDLIVVGVLRSGGEIGSITPTVSFTFKKAQDWIPDETIDALLSPKSRAVAFLLALFLGIFGAHRFYLGRPASALAQLLLTLSFVGIIITAIWSLIDVLRILVGKLSDGEGLPVSRW